MTWSSIRQSYPHRWLVVEALQATSTGGFRRIDDVAVIDAHDDSPSALRTYQRLHRESPSKELYVLHTDRETLEIEERIGLSLRRSP